MCSFFSRSSQTNIVSVPSFLRITAQSTSEMNFSVSPVTRDSKSSQSTTLPAIVCLEDPLYFTACPGEPSKVGCKGEAELSVSRLVEHIPPTTRTNCNSQDQLLLSALESSEPSPMVFQNGFTSSSAPIQAVLSADSGKTLQGCQTAESFQSVPFKKCSKTFKQCSNCYQTHSPNWYLSKDKSPLCNACAKYQKRTGMPRPPQHWNKKVRYRKRRFTRGEGTSRCNSVSAIDVETPRPDNDKENEFIEKDRKISKRTRKGTVDLCCSQSRDEKALSDSETENNSLTRNSEKISPRRSKLFEMKQEIPRHQELGKWDKMTTLLSVVQLAKYQGDLALNLVT
ncbi:hypothetical protein GAYE_SCF07G2923 [Galdieria yellowstonensis]|uniref:GATA-type domain-containing protein n=1 Tax=Galdieria yellowstonensis TaxID=3028027 RepID=A0AAV9ICH6_9RHOD|nr:hypothetical protein GAYE_SCF07G2923 [Galdieria yellowstonensis]